MNGRLTRWIQREFRSLGGRIWVVLLAIAIGVGAVNGVHSLADSIRSAIQDQSRPLMAADFVTQSVHPFPTDYLDLSKQYETSETREMLSMVSSGTYESVLAEIKGASDEYPLYGEVTLESGQSLFTQLTKDTVVVQRSILKRLNLNVGEPLNVNGETFTIADVVLSESDRVNVGMAAGPRVFLSMEGLDRTKLDQFGSRVTRRIQWKVDEEKSELLETLNKLEETHSFVSTQSATRSNPSTARSINNSERFLGVVALMSLLIGTIGVVQSLSNWLASRRKEMAIFRCLGMSRGEILQIYVTVILLLGLGGSILGIGFSYVGMLTLLEIVQPYIPIEIVLQPSIWNWLSALVLGVGVSILSTLPSIVSTTQIPASVALQEGTGEQMGLAWYWYGLYGVILFGTLYSQLYNALWAAAGVGTLVVIIGTVYALVMGIQTVLRSRTVQNWTLRHAIRNFASTAFGLRTAIVALTLGVMVITSIGLMQHSITDQIRNVSLTSAPTNFFVDIQPEQWTETKKLLEDNDVSHLQSAPVVMGRISSIKGVPVSEIVEEQPDTQRWAYTREQRLSYDVPVDPETILEGVFDDSSPDNAICLEIRYAEQLGLTIGDNVTFDIQGIPIEFEVTATRRIQWETMQMNFFLVAKGETLAEAPQFRLAAAQLSEEGEEAVQIGLAKSIPNVTVVSLRNIVERVAVMLDSIALAIQTMGAFSMLMGGIIMVSSLQASLERRRKQFRLLSILGSTQGEISHMVSMEMILTGVISGVLGSGLAWLCTWGLLRFVFRMTVLPSLGWSVLSAGLVIGVIACLGRIVRPG